MLVCTVTSTKITTYVNRTRLPGMAVRVWHDRIVGPSERTFGELKLVFVCSFSCAEVGPEVTLHARRGYPYFMH